MCRLSEHVEVGDAFVGWLNSVFDDGLQIDDEGLKAVDLSNVGGLFGKSLVLGGGGALGGSHDGSAGGLGLGLVIVVDKDGGQEVAHVPFHEVGQHAKQNVSADPVREAVMNGSHRQIDGLQTAEGPLAPG